MIFSKCMKHLFLQASKTSIISYRRANALGPILSNLLRPTTETDCNIRLLHSPTQGMACTTEKNLSGKGLRDEEAKLIMDITKLIIDDELIKFASRSSKVIEYQDPERLRELLDLSVGKDGISHEALYEALKTVLKYSTQTGHPYFMNQQYGARDIYGLIGEFITSALNTNVHTYEIAPVFVLVEMYMLKKLNEFIGYPEDTFDGLFTPGGSLAILYSMHLARFKWNSRIKQEGIQNFPKLSLFTSTECHYSVSKGAAFLGYGLDSVYKVRSDQRGKMDVKDLEAKIIKSKNKGECPVYVNATCGSTVLGSFDPIDKIADICQKYDMWLNVDGAWGASVLVSEKHRHLMKGIERSDSVLWNSHKMLGAPLQCSTLLIRHQNILRKCFTSSASYLFQQDKFYDVSYDIGDRTVICGRKGDAFKLWTMWKARGDKGIANIVDTAMDNAKYLTEKIRKTPGFKLVLEEYEYTNISFWYIPPRLRGQVETDEWWAQIKQIAPKIKEKMVKTGSLMIGFQPLEHKKFVNFFRIIVENPSCKHEDMDYAVEEIDRLGQDM